MTLRGRLLVAAPQLVDPNFARTVVLVVEHDRDGAFGVVLNRPTETFVADAVGPWAEVASDPAVVFFGGPVGIDRAIGLGIRADARSAPGCPAPGWVPLCSGLGSVDLAATPAVAADVRRLRVFVGSSGWGAGQLEGEIEEASWFVVDADPEADVFGARPDRLWAAVLRRQSGRLAWFANAPEDLSAN